MRALAENVFLDCMTKEPASPLYYKLYNFK